MTHRSILEWGRIPVGEGGFSRLQAERLLAACRQHPLGGVDGAAILTDHHRWLRSQQMVGMVAVEDCSLEILPKIDGLGDPETATGRAKLRERLVHMLDVALGLDIGLGRETAMAQQDETLLDILIAAFADQLATAVRRGLPRQYLACEGDLTVLRGRLDVTRQFTTLLTRPDRLACRYDVLSADHALLQIMKCCAVFLFRHARRAETRRRLTELRLALSEITDVRPQALRWDAVRIDRSNVRWRSLLTLARLFLRRAWQGTHRGADPDNAPGVTLLFPMNDLFEAYVAALLRSALAPEGYEVVTQGGLRHCLVELAADGTPGRGLFQTKPDCLVRKNGRTVLVLDTKWKQLAARVDDPKRGVAQGDIYQLMAYARLYDCDRLMLLYPYCDGLERQGVLAGHRINAPGASERLEIAALDITVDRARAVGALQEIVAPVAQRDLAPGFA